MKQKIKLFSIVISLGSLCTACNTATMSGAQGNVQSGVSPSVQTSDSAVTSSREFYSSWNITFCIGTSIAYALSEDEINSFIGTTITYNHNVYKNENAQIDISGYEEKSETSDDFYNNFGIHLTDIGITEENVTVVSVGTEGEFFGSTFYIKDLNTLVIYYEGVFFEATRT